MCLVIARWDATHGLIASDGRMMQQLAAPVCFGSVPKTVAADDVFKVHRLTPSLIVGIVGWAHVADELLTSLRAELTTYDEPIVSGHMMRLKAKYPRAALQCVLIGVRDSVHAATWSDGDPAHAVTPAYPVTQLTTIVLAEPDLRLEAYRMVRRVPLNQVFETLARKYPAINSAMRVEEISL